MFGALLNLVKRWVPSLLPTLLTERPDLIVDHALAYVALAKRELELAKQYWLRRAVAGAVALACALSFVMLSGIALMLYATAQPRENMAWLLLAVPGAMLGLTLLATVVALSKGTPPTESLSAQLRIDVQAFRAVMESRS